MPQFLLSERTSYPFKKYFPSQDTDWSDGGDQSLLTPSKRSKSLQPKFSRWQQLNSLVAERHEGDQFESLRQSTKHSSLALPAREYDGDLTETLKLRIAGAAFGVRKKERQKINDVFLSLAPGPGQTRENLNDDNSNVDNEPALRSKPPPSVGPLQKPNLTQPSDDADKKGLQTTKPRGLSLERGLGRGRVRGLSEWRLSASPVLQSEAVLRRQRLERIAHCHHIPRVDTRLRSLRPSLSLLSVGENKKDHTTKIFDDAASTSEDSGQDTLSASGDSEIYFSSESSKSSSLSSAKVTKRLAEPKIVHSYIASRGQRERETDIYEVNPPPFLSCQI